MRYAFLLVAVSACVGLVQAQVIVVERSKADLDADTPARRAEAGAPPDWNQVIRSDLNLVADLFPYVLESAGVTSVQRLQHKVPKKAEKAFKRAAKLSQARKNTEAARELERAIAADPGFADAHINLGVQYYLLSRSEDAERILRRAIELDPSSAAAHSNLATVELLLGEVAAAERHARQALALSPGNERAKRTLDSARQGIEHEANVR